MSNPSPNEALFTRAADFLVEQKFDLRALMRAILQSETYQRTSVPLPGNQADTRFYSRYYPRRMMAEVLHDAIAQVSGVPTTFKTQDVSNSDAGTPFPAGWRALQLPDANTDSYFTRAFGRASRDLTCECERTAEPSVTQALHMSNGDTINKKLTDPQSVVGKALAANAPIERVIDDAYLAVFARPASAVEKQRIAALFTDGMDANEKRARLEDTYWALLSSREFLFNH